MRLRTLSIATCLLLGCSDGGVTPRNPAGVYDLVSINGATVPTAFPPDSFFTNPGVTVYRTMIFSEQVRLFADGRRAEYTLEWGDTAIFTPPGDTVVHHYQDHVVGHWEDAGLRIRFVGDSIGLDGGPVTAFQQPDTIYFDKGPEAGQITQQQPRERKSLGPRLPPTPYAWLFTKE